MEDNKQLLDRVQSLGSPLGDGWGALRIALQDLRAHAKRELTAEEFETLEKCIRALDLALHRRHGESEVELRIGSC